MSDHPVTTVTTVTTAVVTRFHEQDHSCSERDDCDDPMCKGVGSEKHWRHWRHVSALPQRCRRSTMTRQSGRPWSPSTPRGPDPTCRPIR